jgi:hypothetical protein
VSLNAKSKNAAIASIGIDIFELLTKKRIKEDELELLENILRLKPDWNFIYDTFAEKHSIIAHQLCNDAGISLMNKDSRIMKDILEYFLNKEIPCLPMHDSVIIQEKYQEELKQVMEATYSKHMNGFTCKVEQK